MLAARDVYFHKVLIYHAAGTEIKVSDFGISHLAVRKAYILSAGLKASGRIFCPEGINERCPLDEDGI